MRTIRLDHLSDADHLRALFSLLARERIVTAMVVAHIAEIDARKLYLRLGFESMRSYCVEKLHFSEDAAYKRIQAARAARKFPAILTALAESRLHLAAVCLLTPHLIPENVGARTPRARMTPISAESYVLQFTIGKDTHEKLCHVQALLSHRLPSGDIAQVFDRALDALKEFSSRSRSLRQRRSRGSAHALQAPRATAERLFGAGFMNEKRLRESARVA